MPQPTPPVPHAAIVSLASHVLPPQHPLAHVVESHLVTHDPLVQMRCAPHDPPSFTLLAEPHIGPLAQDIVPLWQGLSPGWQTALGVQETQTPLLHTPLATVADWHEVPSVAAFIESVHVGTPPAHEVTLPVPQGLPGGVHDAVKVHALQTPE